MAEYLSVGDNVRWHRPQSRTHLATLVDGSTGVVTVVALDPGADSRGWARVQFDESREHTVFVRDLTVLMPDPHDVEEVDRWLAR